MEHTFEHERGGGTCTCGLGPYCLCGYCKTCGRMNFDIPLKEVNTNG